MTSSTARQREEASRYRAANPVSVLIVDSHPIFRYGVHRLLETQPGFTVVGEAADGLQAVDLARRFSPQIVILDLGLRDRSGLEVLGELAGMESQMRTIIFTAAIDKAIIVQAIKLGARGIVLKKAGSELLIDCITAVLQGRYWVGREMLSDVSRYQFLPQTSKPTRPHFGLTARELEVVAAVAGAYTNKEIAQQLSLKEQTVKCHVTNIFDKLGVSNRVELVLFAVSHQLVDVTGAPADGRPPLNAQEANQSYLGTDTEECFTSSASGVDVSSVKTSAGDSQSSTVTYQDDSRATLHKRRDSASCSEPPPEV